MNHTELHGAVILIVDDHPENLGVLFECFQEHDCTVLICENGEDALEIAEKNRPDIILLDILMPGIGGFETCRRLKDAEKTREIPVLFVSSLSEAVDKVRAFELAGVDFITKPFQTDEVLARVNAHLGYHKLKLELVQKNRRLEEEIAQHKMTEHALQTARDAANSANRTKSVFLANMSHELRTPLHGILGYTRILQNDKGLSQQQQEALTTILKQGDYLLTLIEEILEFSKIETKRVELHPHCFRLPELLARVVDDIRPLALQKDLRFTVNISKDLPLIVYGDRQRIRQILSNVLQNAVKFTARGGIKFHVAAKRWQQTASNARRQISLHIKVEDSGIGIPEHQLPSIFEPFKTSGEQYNQVSGAGLSLAVSRYFARMMDGDISAESIAGEGTVFYIDLDVSEAYSAEMPEKDVIEDDSVLERDHDESPPPLDTQLHFPSDTDLKLLREAALIGDIMAIRKWVQEKKKNGEKLLPFIGKIDRLAQNFDIGSLQEFLHIVKTTE